MRRTLWIGGLVGMLAALALLPGVASATVVYPPRLSAAVRTAEGFELKGVVYDYGGITTYHFEYGTTTAYGTSVPMPDAEAGTGYSSAVSQLVTGLAADTVYHYRLVSNNTTEGMGVSEDGTFSTAVTPASPPPSAPPAGDEGTATVGTGSKKVAKTLHLKGRTLLTTTSGRTLYSLSAERRGRFICTEASGCTGIWKPLTIPVGVTPKGPVKLGTIERPEGTVQVTYRGLPLYSFAGDKQRGQVKGEGLKDVGTWHPATISGSGGSGSNPTPSPSPPSNPYPGAY